jgi:hypothetical protein
MNVSRLETIEQIPEFLNGTAGVAFSNPADESALRTCVTTVIRRYRYFSLNFPHADALRLPRCFDKKLHKAASRQLTNH